jgi:POT family proton-dependent oligopeptide transporter
MLTLPKGAIVADSWLGKVKTIIWFSVAYMLGLIVLFVTSLPISIENGYAFAGLMTAMILIGLCGYSYSCFASLLTSTQRHRWHQVKRLTTHRGAIYWDETKRSDPPYR